MLRELLVDVARNQQWPEGDDGKVGRTRVSGVHEEVAMLRYSRTHERPAHPGPLCPGSRWRYGTRA